MEKNKQDTINKSLLLNWLYSADKDLSIEELGRWIAAKTDGKYILVENTSSATDADLSPQILAKSEE